MSAPACKLKVRFRSRLVPSIGSYDPIQKFGIKHHKQAADKDPLFLSDPRVESLGFPLPPQRAASQHLAYLRGFLV